MNAVRAGLIAVICFAMLSACSRDLRGTDTHAGHANASAASIAGRATQPGDSTVYPYDLWIGRSLNHVDREPEPGRLRVAFVRWSENPYGGREAVFAVTNPGDRAVLVWNVRQQVRVAPTNAVAARWDTRQSDYPGRGWERSTIPAGGSVHFPMSSPGAGDWRVCLLYGRETPDSHEPNRRFDGTYESIGPSVREDAGDSAGG